ncbi:LLM class flavin-dependent oxidoreductase [Rhodococcus qingshengii]|uniref:LLM class flavin-dependent oxidoreductase n=1 Tax=Rhodococcus qingshengii TaxID=334542 RepID=UPI0010A65FF0|nr:LLM class flavin-dependent oxidoreductase [Rhodococcus qingshengii]THJ67620.1 LLM class flavin-dependent oxidoreductase [Rhodococcus qingshengii]
MSKQLMFNIFTMNTVSHVNQGMWRHPGNKTVKHNELDTWIELAQLAEKGLFDAIFLADGAGLGGDFDGDWSIYPERGLMFPIGDPLMLIPAMAQVTKNIGFIVTSAPIQHPPFSFARSMATLDHLTNGRLGWNVVTNASNNAHRNVGLDGLVEHDKRYDIAEEYLEVVYKLWESSWDEDAVVRDVDKGVYADPTKVHKINHEGTYFRCEGPLQLIPSPQRTPMLFQAGGSEVGRNFGARHAEGIFVMADTPAQVAPVIADMRERAVQAGRSAGDLKFFQGLTFVVGATLDEAQRKAAELDEYLDPTAAMAYRGGFMGIDFASVDPDTPLSELIKHAEGIQGPLKLFIDKQPEGANPTVRDLASFFGAKYRVVGTPELIADELSEWAAAGVDGINIISIITPGTYAEFIEHVVPVLQDRGLMKTAYAPGTLREKMYGPGHARLGNPHPAAAHRKHLTPTNQA